MRDAVRRFHDAGVRTALVSNSWRDADYDALDAFDAVVLSQAARDPQTGAADLRKRRSNEFELAANELRVRR